VVALRSSMVVCAGRPCDFERHRCSWHNTTAQELAV
jgi:hypothetical protein